jgi:signal transduction histidine kinase
MNRFLLLTILILFSCKLNAQLFRGIDHLNQYEPKISEMDAALKSNPVKFSEIYNDLRAIHRQKKDETLGAALDVYQGSFHYFQNNLDSSGYYFDLAMDRSSKIGQDQIFRTAKIRKIFTDEYKKTKYQMAQEMRAVYVDSYNKKDTINLIYSLNGLGIFYGDMDSVSYALASFYEALRMADLSKNMNEKGFIHNNLGLVKYDLGAKDSAFSDFQQCLRIGEEMDNAMLQAIARQNMGLYYSSVDSSDLAKEQYMKVNKMGNEFGYTLYILSSITNLASLEMTMGNPEASDSLSNLALKIAKEGNVLFSVPTVYYGKAYYKMRTEEYSEALRMLDSAYVYSKYAQYSEIMPPYYHLKYRIYEEMGDHEKALETYKEKVELNDSLDAIGNEKLLAELQFRYDDEKKERIRSVEQNKLKLQVKQGEVELAQFQQNLVIIVSVLLGIIFIAIILYFRLKQKSDNLFSHTIANKLEEERSRIARDLHDGLGQSMIVLKNKFNKLEIENDQEVDHLNDNFSEVIEEVRSISRSLIPPELKRLGLQKAIQNMMDEIEKSSGYIITTEIESLVNVKFEEFQSIRIYRIVQELCTNTLKHSGATSIKLEAIVHGGTLVLIYQDNGKGLDMDKWKAASNSVGFKSIEQRLKFLKGTAKVDKVKTGFKINFKIPINS